MKTYHAKPNEVPRKWLIMDLEGKTLGRIATKIASILRGKNKPQFSPDTDTGDFVIAINADKIKLTGRKLSLKKYQRYSGYRGGLSTVTAEQMLEYKPTELLRSAVKGMLPKNTMGRKLLTKLKIYAAAEHPHAAQKPTQLEI